MKTRPLVGILTMNIQIRQNFVLRGKLAKMQGDNNIFVLILLFPVLTKVQSKVSPRRSKIN